MSLAPAELERFVEELAASPERWRHLVRHAGDVRVFEQIWADLGPEGELERGVLPFEEELRAAPALS
jgi:hypothetical protein